MEEKILTLHPEGKKGVNILKRRYDQIAACLLEVIQEHTIITYSDANDLIIERLTGKFDGKITWYVVSVKLDLEARGIIERIPKTSPHQLRMKSKN